MARINVGSISLNYESYGEGEPLLLIMGFAMPGAAWLPSLPFLAGFRCIYFDNRGTGASDKPDGPYTVADMAEDANGLLDALKIPQAKVFGVSMGGMIAQELALRHPEKVARLVLGCTTPGGAHGKMAAPEVLETLTGGTRLMATDPEKGFDTILPILYPPEFIATHPEIKQLMMAGMGMMAPTPPETVDRLMAGLPQFDTYDRLPQIKCPVLIVHGSQDILVPTANAAILKERLAQAEVFMIPGAGHAFQAVDPVGIHQRIATWLKS
jgi:pimeloyl-ACP methyl ester carboxylesterase